MRNLKTKISKLVFFALATLVSCQSAPIDLETEVINAILPKLLEEYSDIAPSRYEHGARILLMTDSLVIPAENYLLSILMKGRDFQQYLKMDSAWNETIISFSQPDSITKRLKVKELQGIKDYKILPTSSHSAYNEHDIVGTAIFSRIAFDHDRSRACLYYSFRCSAGCGEGHMVFLEKISGHWKIVHVSRLWIA